MTRVVRTACLGALVAILGSAGLWSRPLTAQPSVAARPARATAPWIRDAVIYELNTRTFSREGTFNGVIAGLDSLQHLGVDVLWIMPIHPLAEVKKKGSIGSPYAVRDYYAVNPAFGTKADFRRLVEAAHARGMKVILDVVANHTGWDNVMMRTPAYYRRDSTGAIVSPYDWTDVAALNYANPALRQYMTDMLVYWAKEFALDGFRCDVAFEVPTDFWEAARTAVETVRPDILMLAEAHKPELMTTAFDLDYAWPLHSALTEVFMQGAPATRLREVWQQEVAEFPVGTLHLRISDDHDETRAIARFGARGALAASALMFALDGVPLLYQGMEVGDNAESGDPALFEKLDVFWASAKRRPEFPPFYHQWIAFRKAHRALRRGRVEWVGNSEAERLITFVRRDSTETLLVAINASNRPLTGRVEMTGAATDITPTRGASTPATLPAVSLEAWGYRVYRIDAR